MPKKKQPLQWQTWSHDPRLRFACYDGGLRVRAPGTDGLANESTWCKLIGHNVDVTVRRLLYEMGYLPRSSDG
jgi:hypothetical protein